MVMPVSGGGSDPELGTRKRALFSLIRPGVTPLELSGFCWNAYFSQLIEAQRHAQYRGGFAFVS